MEYLKILQPVAQAVPGLVARIYAATVTMFGFLVDTVYWVTVPLRYPAYWALTLVSWLLSPLWLTWRLFSGAAQLAMNILSTLRHLYTFFACAILVGLIAALVVHGVSLLLSLLLSVHPSQEKVVVVEQPPTKTQQRVPTQNGGGGGGGPYRPPTMGILAPNVQHQQMQNDMGGFDAEQDPEDYYYVEGNDGDGESLAGSSGAGRFADLGTTTSSESAFNNATTSRRRSPQSSSSPILNFGSNDMHHRQWRPLSSSMKPNAGPRRGGSIRSLLAQTIHEESSESDSL